MPLFLIACVVSFLPYLFLFLWLRGLRKNDAAYRELCGKALGRGALCIFPVVLLSGVSYVLLRLTGIHKTAPLLYQAVYDFVVLAFMEEFAKFRMFRRTVRQADSPVSWLDAAALMTIVGIGFGAAESVEYAIGASIPVVLVRGICMPHAGYGFITGYFWGKGVRTGRPAVRRLGFVISWLVHGLYDLSLSEAFLAVSEDLVFVPLLLALLEIVFVIRLIFFARKARNRDEYTEPLPIGS